MAGPALHDSYSFVGVHLSTYADIDRWMLYVTRNGVKKLKLNMTKDDGHDALMRRRGLVVEGTRRGRGRPKKYWGEVIRQDLAQFHLTEDMTLDRKEWRLRIKVEGLRTLYPPQTPPSGISLGMLLLLLLIDNPIPADNRLTLEKLLLSSPTLETLCLGKFELEDKTTDDIVEGVMKYLDTPACLDKTLNKLEDVSIHSFNYSKVIRSFIKLLFAHASSLSRMSIYPDKASSSKEELNVATELMRFPRLSPKAELIYHPNEELD
ncbi:hypothetical protein H5410_021275 [Solanum commersonii]|uniref:FBD domain-containing protein n=1 Tax=Solanum commersonii TaxID=4109 RepID=A0A9J5ZBI1_SOLCO|nr:hypothetical protein H5410_021275 [Solanum commersonii]